MTYYPYAYVPTMVGYQRMQGIPMQGMVGMPVMDYATMTPVQGYAMPTAYAYSSSYYK